MSNPPLIRLIEAEDPIFEVWNILKELWRSEGGLKEYFSLESQCSLFEQKLNKVFFEFYRYLYNAIKGSTLRFGLPLIIVDGMSLREGNLFLQDLRDKGYSVTSYGYSFSALPSTTSAFREKLNVEYVEIKSGRIPSEIDFKSPVWLSFPDEILHHAAALIPLDEAYEKTRKALFEVLDRMEGGEVTIVSDHGYIVIDDVWPLSESDRRFLKSIFGAQRFSKNSEIEPNKLKSLRKIPEDKSYVFVDEQYSYVKGRYFWPISGYGRKIAHGGLSLMECIVPLIRVRV